MPTAEMSTVILPRSPQGEFRNEPFVDFSHHENAHAMKEALVHVGDQLGHEYELVIGGEHLRTSGKIRALTAWLRQSIGDPAYWDNQRSEP